MKTALWIIAICELIRTAVVVLDDIIEPLLEGLGVIR